MAVNVLYKEYEVGAVGAAALIKDIHDMFSWDGGTYAEGAYVADFYKGDVANGAYAGLRFTPSSTYPVGFVLCKQPSSASEKNISFGSNGGTAYTQHVNIAAWENGISICFPDASNIWSDSGGKNRVAMTVGVCRCKNAVTGENGWCSFIVSWTDNSAYYTYVLGQSATSTTSYSKHYDSIETLPYTILHPIYSGYSNDIPNDILIPQVISSDGIPAMYGYCDFGGRRYYKNGHIFIPA